MKGFSLSSLTIELRVRLLTRALIGDEAVFLDLAESRGRNDLQLLPVELVLSSLKRLPSTEEAMTVGLLLLCREGKDGSVLWKYQSMCVKVDGSRGTSDLPDANA